MSHTFETIRYTADVVCIRGGAVLLIERGWPPHKGQLALPGGHVDPGKTSRAAATRELLEETGVHIDADHMNLIGVYDAPDDTTAQAGDDAAAIRWVPLDDTGSLAFDHGEIVAAARHQHNAPF
ncbi:NUDIX domain-containing protein [Streptomyces sp. NPDC018955]|uniref:NUDIX domain-containing protein n=1 Tax=Streptomyces sp. NPDC018955 TaxID=3365055 RepID=UPI0037A5557C